MCIRDRHETLVLVVENILHQIVFQQTAHPQTSHQQADIARTDGKAVSYTHLDVYKRQIYILDKKAR